MGLAAQSDLLGFPALDGKKWPPLRLFKRTVNMTYEELVCIDRIYYKIFTDKSTLQRSLARDFQIKVTEIF
jgi:hypothetical protein